MKYSNFFFILAGILFITNVGAQSNSPANLLFIFDASGSMWGKIENSTKIEVARETMGKLSNKIAADSKVGLIAYGHKSATDCNDIETLLPLGNFNKEQFNGKIKMLNPKGKTPIAKSINHALSLIKEIKDPVTIILVSDGLETCEGNACETVRNARTAGIKLTMHVVGFGISEKDLSPLECTAQAGGGQYFAASNAEELVAALEQTVKDIPAGDAYLSVKTTLEGKLKDASVRVFKKGESGETISGRTYEGKETNPRILQLQAGTYDVEIMPIAIRGYSPIRIPDLVIPAHDTLFKEIEFEQGELEILITRNGELSDATIQIFPAGSDKLTASTRSYNKAATNPAKIKIPPGVYDIVFSSVEISGRPEIKITRKELGSSSNLKFNHNFESGELSIEARQGGQLVDATVSITDTKTGKNVGAGRTYQTAQNNPKKFILEPGNYKVELSPVKPAGLARKTITVDVIGKALVAKTVDW